MNRGRGGRGRGRQYRSSYQGRNAPQGESETFEANWNERIDDFDQMELKPLLLRGIYNYGFRGPSDIQSLSIKPILMNRCVIAQAQSGTGKTGAFAIGILNRIDTTQPTTQALVLAPTRELATQIYYFFVEIGSKMADLKVELFKGGNSVADDQAKAQECPHIAVSTPGRALDLISKGYLRCENIQIACIDEADEMLGEGFISQIKEIFEYLNKDIQFLLFSATFPKEILSIIDQFMNDPVKILVKAEMLTLEGIKQFYVNVETSVNKFPTLLDIYGSLSIQKAVIFANSKETVEYLQKSFEANEFNISAIHGGMEQAERDRIMHQFRTGNTRALVSTDLLARGIDVQQITLVINFELPNTAENYLHRIGRSGRYGRKGIAINICDASDMIRIKEIEKIYQTQIAELPADIADLVKDANSQFDKK
ncbi:eukaryotic translation initiation factor, putative [Trichomonas vaginalis G3]|uniref:Eukaryotic translation initiation factor, putative n=1 Tax=Trichomonas vaginalis (strain ATCC PRA-98 / G3) TaxID=412133 RepID=A2EGV2_TRIV3|nr:ATP-dependent RNA helicase DBP3 family [Trichomonas vaginalis G3]EAY08086.1 eukaryotic translation initiation factor, putative [Trichomonas vaginalis G3]KAI5496699.1 ATP-dependent RNA helicase DBP3 family [Trichomonas vaginalis G3]|eukprot:XP_001320309.1 eukaryotic translation initiation factor [Trichomonas vaginalis G3]